MTKIEEMRSYCEENQVYWFCDLADYSSKKRGDWFRTLITEHGAKTMGRYLASKAHNAGLLTDEQYADMCDDE